MTDNDAFPADAARRLKKPLALTRLGMTAERAVRAFWPLWSILIAVLGALMLGFQDIAPLEAVWGLGVLSVLGAGWALARGTMVFRWPSRGEALDRLDRTLTGRPITAVADRQAIGAGDSASEAVWRAHVDRMAERLAAARAPEPDLKLSARDPYALRYVALLLFTVAILFGSLWQVRSVADATPGAGAVAAGPTWEGWVEPPLYTGQPSIYLNDVEARSFAVPEGSRVTIRFYGEVGRLTLTETVSGRTEDVPPATDPDQSFEITGSGEIVIDGPGGRTWQIEAEADALPEVEFDGPIVRGEAGRTEAPFAARDDYGVTAGQMRIALDLDAVDRRYGLSVAPEPRDEIVVDLPMTISGDRTDFSELVVEDFSKHPWANLPVEVSLTVEDAVGQTGLSAPQNTTLPGRRFFDPLAKAVVEQRRDLLWNRDNARRVSQVLRAVSAEPDSIFRSETLYMKLRFAVRRMETRISLDQVTDDFIAETADVLWDLAVEIEEGDLSDALERLRRAQDRLAEAIENGATDEEIAELMQELREAMQDYMRQLAEQQGSEQNQQQAQNQQGEQQEITGDQLQDMLDRLQELMEQGRMAEAEQLLNQLRQMMENMQVAQGQQGQQSPGEQAMEGLAETLREQQGLSDEAFRDLQEQFNPDAQAGQSQENEGEGGQGEGRGAEHGEGQGQGQGGQQQGGGSGQTPQGGPNGEQSLADRQQALRQELDRQRNSLPGAGTPEGDAARDALGRAGEAMDEAEDALRQEDFAGALDNQADAMEALREGMRELAEQMAEQQQNQQGGQQGQQAGRGDPNGTRDPLGREQGQNGRIGTDEQLLQGEDVYRRARELLDEIRRRSGEQERPTEELEYLKRLLERF
ncbi:TIGR02302 family protein [Alphaproteobacteria bacterium GH1-50]|uniref:TIGR02302 family protein n=1 Tax=Kangsaoukella pontilimi TaxID=2691042 RepID=A0A7C9MSJ1_9RHOB|nr:TIGR02302 family protein [Kangsaoukella pontilimi]MXQ09337.1 TIGR02302 family protein [Kangsaoukella pontilimi]